MQHAFKPSYLFVILGSTFLSGCNLAERLSNVGEPPEMSQIQDPTLVPSYQPVTMPMPLPESEQRTANSLWQTGSRAFFKDQRAGRVGDILTILVDINDQNKIDSTYNTSRATTNKANLNKFFGFESKLDKVFPKAVDPTNLVDLSSTPTVTGKGLQDRKDKLDLKVAAIITQVLPNGNLVVQGRQEVRITGELRLVEIKGIIRREDISSSNTINYSKIAEARISYGGRGDISDANSTPWGQQVTNKILPW